MNLIILMYHVFSHYPCNDGEVSRAVWQYFRSNSQCYPWKHHDHAKEINIINHLPYNSNVVFLDVTPPIELLSTKHIYTVIDHHKEPLLQILQRDNSDYRITIHTEPGFPENNKMSGCVLTWRYFTQRMLPSIVNHIGRKDIWDFSDPNTEAYCIGYNIAMSKCANQEDRLKLIFSQLNTSYVSIENSFIEDGMNTIQSYKTRTPLLFNSVIYDADIVDGIEYSIIEIACNDTELFKYLIEYAEQHYPDTMVLRIHHSTTPTQKLYSLRSIQPNVTVDNLARKYGGNGHARAAGYSRSLND